MDALTSEELEHYTRNKIIMNDEHKREGFYRYHNFLENIQNNESMGDLIPKESIEYKYYLKYLNRVQRTYNSFNNIFNKTPEYERRIVYRDETSLKTIYRKEHYTYKSFFQSYRGVYQTIYRKENAKECKDYYLKKKDTKEYKERNAKSSKTHREKNKDNKEYKDQRKKLQYEWYQKVKDTEEYKEQKRRNAKLYYEKKKAKQNIT